MVLVVMLIFLGSPLRECKSVRREDRLGTPKNGWNGGPTEETRPSELTEKDECVFER